MLRRPLQCTMSKSVGFMLISIKFTLNSTSFMVEFCPIATLANCPQHALKRTKASFTKSFLKHRFLFLMNFWILFLHTREELKCTFNLSKMSYQCHLPVETP